MWAVHHGNYQTVIVSVWLHGLLGKIPVWLYSVKVWSCHEFISLVYGNSFIIPFVDVVFSLMNSHWRKSFSPFCLGFFSCCHCHWFIGRLVKTWHAGTPFSWFLLVIIESFRVPRMPLELLFFRHISKFKTWLLSVPIICVFFEVMIKLTTMTSRKSNPARNQAACSLLDVGVCLSRRMLLSHVTPWTDLGWILSSFAREERHL